MCNKNSQVQPDSSARRYRQLKKTRDIKRVSQLPVATGRVAKPQTAKMAF